MILGDRDGIQVHLARRIGGSIVSSTGWDV